MANISIKNLAQANKVLAAAAPQYRTGSATQKAYAALKQAASQDGKWGKRIRQSLEKLENMGDFDPNKSAYYQSAYDALKTAYTHAAKHNMLDTLATAAANTEGYGNSYAATAANRAYRAQMQALANKTPSVYAAAAGEFANQKQALATLVSLQQEGQRSDIENAKFALQSQQALDKQRYESEQALDSAARANAMLYWQRYLAGK